MSQLLLHLFEASVFAVAKNEPHELATCYLRYLRFESVSCNLLKVLTTRKVWLKVIYQTKLAHKCFVQGS